MVLISTVFALSLYAGSRMVGSTTHPAAAPPPEAPPAEQVLTLPPSAADVTQEQGVENSAGRQQATWKTAQVKSGDTLSAIFDRHLIEQKHLHNILQLGKPVQALKRIYPGQKIELLSEHGSLLELRLHIDRENMLIIRSEGESFSASMDHNAVERQLATTIGVINDSLFLSAQQAGLSDNIIMRLVGIFGWDIDFALDIRKGDSFAVIFEELFQDGERVGNGRILAAEFTNRGKTYRAAWYKDPKDHGDYFDERGRSMRKAFLRTPVNFSRISSRFSLGRKHPVLNKIRAHRGVDYAAPTGTPIKAAGDGRVSYRGRKGGYGKVIEIHHGGKYSTLYAHLNGYARGSAKGSKVRQGQIIGYVGSTGLATGPHLHYEFRVNGVHRNPLTVKLPDAKPIEKAYLAEFKAESRHLFTQLAGISPAAPTAVSSRSETGPDADT